MIRVGCVIIAPMINIVFIGLGGFIGAVSRYLLSTFIDTRLPHSGFPYGTLAVNIFGCLVIGALTQLTEDSAIFPPAARAFVFIGMLGAFTTFSTFSKESLDLLRDGNFVFTALNIIISVSIGLAAVWIGREIAGRML